MLTVKPFIKWAGGKGQLLGIIREKYPETINIANLLLAEVLYYLMYLQILSLKKFL